MKGKRIACIPLILVCCFCRFLPPAGAEESLPALAADAMVLTEEGAGDEPYYTHSDKGGWWWYKDSLPEKRQEAKKKDDRPRRKLPDLKDYNYDQLWAMHPDDFQALLMDFQKKAVMTLTVDATKEYYVMQDIARRKSLAYANVSSYVVQTNPEFSMDGVSPLAAPGKAAVTREKQREVEEKLRQSFDEFAMIYFYQPGCSFCQEQDGIMQYFVRKYEWEIKKIDITRETAHASRFNVTTTPTIILVYKNSTDYIPITAGVASMAELEDRVYRGIRLLSGEITPQNYSIYDFQQGGVLDTTKKGPAQR